MRQVHRREARQLLRHERRVAKETDASIFVSEPEAALFRKLAPEVQEKIVVIPNGIDSIHFSPENTGQKPEVERRAAYRVYRVDGLLAKRRCRDLVQ